MLTEKQLLKFCNSDPTREKIAKPFSFRAYSYATDGSILIRVPRIASVPEGGNWHKERVLPLFDSIDCSAKLVEIPNFKSPKPQRCLFCAGTGKVSICPECLGDEEVEFKNDYSSYICECQSCDGDGVISGSDVICSKCDGERKREVIESISIGCAYFATNYLNMIKKLSGIKIAPTEPLKPAYFKWDDGDGILMPMGTR